MKKLFFILSFIIITLRVAAQSGDGSSGNPFYGTITANVVWSVGNPIYGSTVYVGTLANPDLTVNTGGQLTINAGITVIFTQLTSDLFIKGTGQLTAGGSGTSVTFTKDPVKSHWGHVSFQNMTGTPASSTIYNCIFEFGYSTGTSAQPLLAGGALQIDFNNVVITKCTFRNNFAFYAGAIMVYSNRNTIIRNSSFESNRVDECGGAIIIYTSSTALVENCIFYNNYSKGKSSTAYSGGAIWSYVNTSKIVNCTFVENNSDRAGDAIYSYFSPGMRIINSILWGSNDQFATNGTPGVISNCAFENIKPASAANSIIISPVASDHFTNAMAGDWSLKFSSPCRDAGINSYAGVTIPILDYIGNDRIGPTDIGAYEVILSRWMGTIGTDWNDAGNWQGNLSPVLTLSDVIIPSGATNYPIGSSSQDYTIGTGKYMIVEAGAKAKLGTLTNNGTLNLQSNATGIFSLNMSSYNGTGIANIGMYLTGGGGTNNWKWHYVTVPKDYIGDKTLFTNINPFDLMRYDESKIPNVAGATDNAGWMWHDGYAGTTGFSDLVTDRGYSFYHSNTSAVVNFTNLTSLQTSIGSLPLQYSGTGKLDPTLYGFNLLGNSLTCSLDWNLVTESDPIIRDAVYYTINYKIGSYVRNAPSGINGATNNIPPLQGFLVKTSKTGTSLDFSAAKLHSGQNRYKKGLDVTESESMSTSSVAPMIKLELNNSGNQDETIIWFNDNATRGFDEDYDATKLLPSGSDFDQIYSMDATEKFGINGISLPTESVSIPIAIETLKPGSNYKIISSQLQGLENYKVTLTDKMNSDFTFRMTNASGYSFSSAAGKFPDRFMLTISAAMTALPDIKETTKSFNVYVFNSELNVQLLNNELDGKQGTINIYDLVGRKVLSQDNIQWSYGDLRKIQMAVPQGIYIVEIQTEFQRFVSKINVNK